VGAENLGSKKEREEQELELSGHPYGGEVV